MIRRSHRREVVLIGAVVLSILLHVGALVGMPRFDLDWLYQQPQSAPLETRIVVREPSPEMVAAPAPKPKSRTRARPKPVVTPPALAAPTDAASYPMPVADAGPVIDAEAPAPVAVESVPAEPDPAPPAATAEPPAEYPLRSARLVFDLFYGKTGTKVGQVTHTWTQDGQRYSAESVAEAVGFVSFFFSNRFVQRSEGALAADGLVPDEYRLQRGGKGVEAETARFDWAGSKLALAWRGETRVVDLPAGAQDPVSVLHQMYYMRPLPASAHLSVATSRKVNEYVFDLVGEEEIVTPLGLMRTLHIRRQEPDGSLMEVWLDRDRALLPARIYAVDRKGMVLDQVVREARIEE